MYNFDQPRQKEKRKKKTSNKLLNKSEKSKKYISQLFYFMDINNAGYFTYSRMFFIVYIIFKIRLKMVVRLKSCLFASMDAEKKCF